MFLTPIWYGEFNKYLFKVKNLCGVWEGVALNEFDIPSLNNISDIFKISL